MKHGVYYKGNDEGGYYEIFVDGEFIGTEVSGQSANWLFSYYRDKKRSNG